MTKRNLGKTLKKKTSPTSSTSDAALMLKEVLGKKSAPPFLLVVCPDRIRRERIVQNILKKFCPEYNESSGNSDNLSRINAESLNSGNVQSLIDSVNSLSLFSSQRFILFNETEELNAALNKKILDLLQSGTTGTHLIFTARKLAANSVIYNYFKKNNALIELQELKNLDLTRWVMKELKSEGINVTEEVLPEAIIQCCESDPDKIAELIARLGLYLDGEKATLEDLGRLSKSAPDASEFALIDNLPNKRNVWKSELLLNQIFKAGKNPFALLGLIARTYYNYTEIAYLREKGLNAQQIRQKLSISPWLFTKQFEASKNYSTRKLQKSLESILLADSKLKNRSLGDEAIFSELIQNL